MARYELTDEQYALIVPEFPTNDGKTGHPYDPHRPIINGIFWRLHAGAAWPDIPERYGNWKTIYDRYTAWRRNGIWERILTALQAKLDAQGAIDWEQWSLSGTIVRAHRAAAGAETCGPDFGAEPSNHALGRSVGGFSTKIHLLSDGNGVPLDACLTPGQTHFLDPGRTRDGAGGHPARQWTHQAAATSFSCRSGLRRPTHPAFLAAAWHQTGHSAEASHWEAQTWSPSDV